jgi:cobalt-zinc-cadmium efflux system protein
MSTAMASPPVPTAVTSRSRWGAFAHIVTDLYGFIGTLVAGIVIIITGFGRADSIASLIVVALMLRAAWGLLRETGRILLEAAPEGYAPGEIVTAITSQPGVASVHDVHVRLITSGFPALSAHVLVRPPGRLPSGPPRAGAAPVRAVRPGPHDLAG